jgi:hypothetical protein
MPRCGKDRAMRSHLGKLCPVKGPATTFKSKKFERAIMPFANHFH